MKKIFPVLFCFSLLICTTVFAQNDSFLTVDEVPTASKFLPLPPDPTKATFENDRIRYEWGKTMRDTERGKQAAQDAAITLEYFAKIFSEPFGITISEENTPEIWKLLNRVLETARICSRKSKGRIMRTRPFVQFNEPTPVPKDEKILKNSSSYPSGHTTRGWTIALVLAEINPARQDEILKRGYEYGESRVIVGFHYQSDVDAARVISSTLVNRLHANENFVQQLQKAKKEFLSKK